ncbi:response regulator [Psychromonas ossibalaenae]|uniref:response regulator n=1 Tax=Psychromonas ossibalaenae TaxID=444922 RepID=UPI00035FEE3C|nr:response regulator [Psychromonas ossibalaenae]
MANRSKIACRDPEVIMIYENEEDVLGVATIIAEQVEEYRTLPVNSKIGLIINKCKPAVILLALSSIERNIELYNQIIENKCLDYPHHSVLLCNNRESAAAFRCCLKGLFDDYFVYQPLYEKLRLKMIVHNGLQSSQTSTRYAGINDEELENIGENLSSLIDQSGECRQSLLGSISSCKEVINSPDSVEPDDVSRAILAKINKSHIEPMLADLESSIRENLDSLIGQLLAQKNGLSTFESRVAMINDMSDSNPNQRAARLQKELAEPPLRGRERILVVEDNVLYRDMLVKVLNNENFVVDVADDGLSALKKIKKNCYELILMDLFMPQLDGINTTKQIKAVTGGKSLPVIALTGNKNKELIKKWAEQGLNGYLLKPSNKTEILKAVNKVLDKKK